MSKVVLVTGASRGIGMDIATAFAKKNYKVVINCKTNIDNLLSLKKSLLKFNENILAIRCDVSNYKEVSLMYEEINNTFGFVDILINNAGISHIGLFTDNDFNIWDDLINTNIKGVLNTSHISSKEMIKRKTGNIINISSIWGVTGASCEVIYSMTKSAINGFTRSLGKELAPSNIFVNAIACGFINTSMNDNFTTEEKNDFIKKIPIGRIGSGKDIASLCLYLSEHNYYITSQIINVDGGLL